MKNNVPSISPPGHLVLVLNITPMLTYCAPLALLRECFDDIVACKPASNFQYLSSCYVCARGFRPERGAAAAATRPRASGAPPGGEEEEAARAPLTARLEVRRGAVAYRITRGSPPALFDQRKKSAPRAVRRCVRAKRARIARPFKTDT